MKTHVMSFVIPALMLIVGFFATGCGQESANKYEVPETVVNPSDTTKLSTDSLKILVSMLDESKEKIMNLEEKMVKMETSIQRYEASVPKLWICLLSVVVLVIGSYIYCAWRFTRAKANKRNRQENTIGNNEAGQTPGNSTSQSVSIYEFQRLQKSVNELSEKVSKVLNKMNSHKEESIEKDNILTKTGYESVSGISSSAATPTKVALPNKTLYFGRPVSGGGVSEAYFIKVLEKTDPETRFRGTTSDDITVTFQPLEGKKYITMLTSDDYIREIVQFEDGIPVSHTGITTVRPGKAIFRDGKWDIMEKLIIRFNR